MKLAGAYAFDNEGTPAQRVDVIQNGVLKGFLMSRMPIKNFAVSNGHGRNQPGLMPTGRQGNLIVTSTDKVPEDQMRQKLIDEVKRQGHEVKQRDRANENEHARQQSNHNWTRPLSVRARGMEPELSRFNS